MHSATRFQTDSETLDRNLTDVHNALAKLPDKIGHLHAGLAAYADIQPIVDAVADNDPILVCVLPESIHFLTQIERARATCSTEHPLSGLRHRYCILGLDDFEFAAALACHGTDTLSSVLGDYWEDTASLELDTRAADLFRERGIPDGEMFAEQFLRGMFSNAQQN